MVINKSTESKYKNEYVTHTHKYKNEDIVFFCNYMTLINRELNWKCLPNNKFTLCLFVCTPVIVSLRIHLIFLWNTRRQCVENQNIHWKQLAKNRTKSVSYKRTGIHKLIRQDWVLY